MKLHTKPLKRKNKEKDINKVIMFQAPQNDETVPIEKDIRLVMFQTGVTREIAINTLNKFDGDIVNAIMELAGDI
jgi:NACalpha-BTF3-like transcription factor